MREIGVRRALGADTARVMGLVLGAGLRLVAVGTAIGIVAAIAVARLARNVLVDATAWDPRLLGVAAIIMVAVAAIAAFIPARRASTIDPIVVLREQ
jgi:ABC-type antimicrobial peptide transport system permease subunit